MIAKSARNFTSVLAAVQFLAIVQILLACVVLPLFADGHPLDGYEDRVRDDQSLQVINQKDAAISMSKYFLIVGGVSFFIFATVGTVLITMDKSEFSSAEKGR